MLVYLLTAEGRSLPTRQRPVAQTGGLAEPGSERGEVTAVRSGPDSRTCSGPAQPAGVALL